MSYKELFDSAKNNLDSALRVLSEGSPDAVDMALFYVRIANSAMQELANLVHGNPPAKNDADEIRKQL